MTSVRTLAVESEEEGLRLDRWFRRHFPEVPQGQIQKWLRTGQLRVDGRPAKAGLRLAAGQEVRVPPLGERPAPPPAAPPVPVSKAEAAALRALVIHRDDQVLVLNKPPGLAVQGGTRIRRHLDGMLDALRLGAESRPRLVHRLDKDTSGVLLLGRTPAAAARLAAAFRRREARKLYWAAVVGVPRPRRGRIDLALAKEAAGGAERMTAGGRQGRRAETLYGVIEAAGRRAAWLALMALTGRTHQLRVHCAALGTPIIGDGKYGGREAFPGGEGIGRGLHLHARAIALPHPGGGWLRVTAPLPEHMRQTWAFFGFDPDLEGDPFAELMD